MLGARVKRQDTDEEELERQLCQGKGAGEWFRLETGKDKCRDVIQCTASVRKRSDSKEGRKEWREAQIGIILSHWKKSHQVRRFLDCCSPDFGRHLPEIQLYNN